MKWGLRILHSALQPARFTYKVRIFCPRRRKYIFLWVTATATKQLDANLMDWCTNVSGPIRWYFKVITNSDVKINHLITKRNYQLHRALYIDRAWGLGAALRKCKTSTNVSNISRQQSTSIGLNTKISLTVGSKFHEIWLYTCMRNCFRFQSLHARVYSQAIQHLQLDITPAISFTSSWVVKFIYNFV
jgi:hypothetical protein